MRSYSNIDYRGRGNGYFGYSPRNNWKIYGSSKLGWYGIGRLHVGFTPTFKTLKDLSDYLVNN